MVRPRSVGTFLMSRSSTGRKLSAVSSSSSTSARVRSSMRDQVALGHGHASFAAHEDDLVDAVAPRSTRTLMRSRRAVGRFLPT